MPRWWKGRHARFPTEFRFKSGSLYTREVNRSGYCHMDRGARAIRIQYEAANRITRVRMDGDGFDIALFRPDRFWWHLENTNPNEWRNGAWRCLRPPNSRETDAGGD